MRSFSIRRAPGQADGTTGGGRVPLVVYVSYNPATFARDARMLADAECAIGPVQPFDQFLWSFHIELAAVFRLQQS